MTRSTWKLTTSRFALATAIAVGLAAAPFGLDDDKLLNRAAAQTANSPADADADVGAAADVSADSEVRDESGEAEEFVEDADSRIGGTGSVGVSSGEQRYADPASVNVTDDPDFKRYSEAAEKNDLEEAARALARAADRPVTEDYVAEVNEQLGVQTSLTVEQIAEAANEEPLPY